MTKDSEGQIAETHSVSAGLDYPGVGPEHAWLKDSGRAEYVAVSDKEVRETISNALDIPAQSFFFSTIKRLLKAFLR